MSAGVAQTDVLCHAAPQSVQTLAIPERDEYTHG